MQPFIRRVVAAVLAAGAAIVALAQEPPRYRVRDLNALTGLDNIWVSALNNRGDFTLNDASTNRAYLWRGGTLHELGITDGAAFDLNDRGAVVGTWDTVDKGFIPFLSRNGHVTNLNDGLGSTGSGAGFAINARGQVVGEVGFRAFLFDSRRSRYLDVPGSGASKALDINDRGDIVGSAHYGGSDVYERAIVLRDGLVTRLPEPIVFEAGGSYTSTSINNTGTMTVQYFDDVLGQGGSALYVGDSIIDYGLGTYAAALNDRGWAVGHTELDVGLAEPELHAWLFRAKAVYDLNRLLTAAAATRLQRLERAIDINERGQILGYGTRADGSAGVFMATPVPEAPAAFTLLAGLGVLGAVLRTRRRADGLTLAAPEPLVAAPTDQRVEN